MNNTKFLKTQTEECIHFKNQTEQNKHEIDLSEFIKFKQYSRKGTMRECENNSGKEEYPSNLCPLLA